MPAPEVDVRLVDVSRSYGSVVAVSHLTLDVTAGEFLTLLGPSGCGKTTTLNMIAGFLQPSAGEIWLRGRRVESLPPYRRDTAMVFQQYALFPHMTVFENIAFGLRMRRTPAAQLRARVDEALALVGLPGLGDRFPLQLSGGQQQRVALARAIAVRPAVLLLDEPLSNLDLKLREGMRLELKRLHRELGTTTIFVTHDQTEALVLSTRIAVMHQGRIEQVGAPQEIYEQPRSRFVAEFVGQTNLLRGRVVSGTVGPSRSSWPEGSV
jgi:ABC-type Fe3+/spermidine/putrescine transport system ATPase subunit